MLPQRLTKRLRRLSLRLGFERDWPLLFLAAAIGVVMSIVAIAFILPLRALEGEDGAAAWAHEHPTLLLFLIPTVPIVGALLCGAVQRLIDAGVTGPGVSAVMLAVHRKKSRLSPKLALRKWMASTFTIGSGGSAGAEGPIVTIGSSIGSSLAQSLHMTPQNTATLLGCAAAAGISSVFNAPIAGIFFVLEILLRDFSFRTFTPIVIASVISAGSTQAILGTEDPLFALGSDFSLDAFTVFEIPNYVILAALCGLGAVVFTRSLLAIEKLFSRLPVRPYFKPAIGACALGILGLFYALFIQQGVVPGFYGNGYPVIEQLTDPAYYFVDGTVPGDEGALKPAGAMLLILAAIAISKGLATCFTIGSGGAGGLFAPSLLMGAAMGGLMGYIVNQLGWFPSATPAHYAVVGMAAMVAATTHAPMTGILIVYEITRSYELILPLMFTAVLSTIVGRLLYKQSVYTEKLARQGVRVGAMSDLTILRRLSVNDVPLTPAVMVHPADSAQRLLDLSEQYSVTDFVVVDEADQYLGMITANDLKEALVYREAIPLLQVSELLRADLPTVTPDETLDVVLDKFSRHDVHSLAVLSPTQDGAVTGLVTRQRLMRQYQAALAKD